MSDIVAKLEPSLGRRWFGTIALGLAALGLLYVGLFRPPEATGVQIILLIAAAGFAWQAQWNLRVTHLGLYITQQGLYDTDDNLVVSIANIVEVDRGLFAFKPSNGFLLRLDEAELRAWAPGLYWRIGRRLGIGGATNPARTRALAEAIEVLIVERTLGPE
ncbi:MAG: hypothetical protein AAF393_01205 [Pseudomonadota bacterium]